MSLRFQVPHELFPVEHRFTDVGGARIHYVDEGSGEVLLLLHGNPTWSFLYHKLVVALRGRFRCVALDHPGFGLSDAPAGYGYTPAEHSAVLERFCDQLGLRDVTMMVQDWGGPIGLGLAGRRPEIVRRLVIGNTFAWPLHGEARIRAFSWIMGGPIGRAFTRWFNFAPRFFLSRGLAKHVEPRVLDLYMAPWRDPERRIAAVISPRQLIEASEYLAKVESSLPALADRPALIVWGSKDFAFREPERRRFEAAFPKHRTVTLEDASHFVQEDAGEQIAREILSFRNEVA